MLYYSQELRAYELLVLLCALGLLAFTVLLRAPSVRWLAVWAGVSGLALGSHYFGVLAVAPQSAVLLVRAWRVHRLRMSTSVAVGALGCSFAALCALLHYQYARSYHFVLTQIASPFVSERFDAHTVAAGNGLRLGQDLFMGPGGPWKQLVTVVLLCFFLFALINVWRHPKDPERSGAELALMLFLPGLAAAALFQVIDVPYQGRYLLGLWVPLTIVLACGLQFARARFVRVLAAASFVAVSLATCIATATVARFSSREDTRGVARALGVATVSRLIAIDQQWDVLPLLVYRRQAQRDVHATATVRELDVVAMPTRNFPSGTDATPPPPPAINGLRGQIALRQVIHGPTYVVERYVARSAVTLAISPAAGHFSADWRFLYEPAGAR
jgi:hypothetical protein